MFPSKTAQSPMSTQGFGAAWSAHDRTESSGFNSDDEPVSTTAVEKSPSSLPTRLSPGGSPQASPRSSAQMTFGSSPTNAVSLFGPPVPLSTPPPPAHSQDPRRDSSRGWRRALYERQPYEDNYVDPVQFLQDMKKNANIRKYEYFGIVRDTTGVIQQLAFVAIFIVIFALLRGGTIDSITIIGIDVVMLCMWLMCHLVLDESFTMERFGSYLHRALLVGMILCLFSPVFRTLTVSYTDDTIWAMCITLLFPHLLFTDYNYLNGHTTKYEQTLAINAAIVASILLASRIEDPIGATALIALAIIVFALSPMMRHFIKMKSLEGYVALSWTLCGLATGCLLLTIPLLAGLFVCGVFVISFAMPGIFVRLQDRYKFQISGPWDEAKPVNSNAAAEWANAGLLT